MKKISMMMMAITFAIAANAQSFNVGTPTTSTDYFGNTNTTYSDSYGCSTGTTSISIDFLP